MKSRSAKTTSLKIETGFQHLRAGRLDAAAIVADRVLSADPNHHGSLNLSALIALAKGEPETAMKHLLKAVKLKPDESIYWCNLGAAYHQNHRYGEAIAACSTALQLHPNYVNALTTLGSAHFAAEQYEEALTVYDQALLIAPEQALIHAYKADTLRELGRIRSAIQAYEKALELAPDLSYALGNYGLTILGIGQPERALDYCIRATEQEPQNSQGWMNLGSVLLARGELEDAMDAYSRAYELEPDSAMLCTLIGQVWQEVNELEQAIGWYEKARIIEPERIDTRCALAGAILELENPPAAVERYREIIAEHPDHCRAYIGLSQALWEDGDAEGAVMEAQKAVKLKPEDASTRIQLATILASAGDVEAANEANREALSINPHCIPALVNLAQNLRNKLPEEDAQQMEKLLESNGMREGALSALNFGLAHYYDGCKDYSKAASHATSANALHTAYKQERGWNYVPEDYTKYIDLLITQFTPEFFQRTKGMGNASTVPVFIVGMPRSSTTLTEQILASHPSVFGAGERNFAARCFNSLPPLMGLPTGTPLSEFLNQISESQVYQLAQWHLEQLEELVRKAGLTNCQRIVDKMPDNYSLLGWIVTAFPNAKIIHCRRDVRDIAVSCWMTQFKEIRWAFDLTHIAERIKQYWNIMEYWRQTLPVPMLEIDYEETVADQAAQTARLLDFVGLEWDDACLSFHKTDRLVRTASVTQVRQPIYKRSVERWRRYEDALQPLLERLGAFPK